MPIVKSPDPTVAPVTEPSPKKGKSTAAMVLIGCIVILVIVVVMAILAAITILAINPAKNFADTRNATRRADITQILNATSQYISEGGNAVADFGDIPVCTATPACIGTDVACVNLAAILVDSYIIDIPQDPTSGDAADTGYTICQTTEGCIQIDAPHAENDEIITVIR